MAGSQRNSRGQPAIDASEEIELAPLGDGGDDERHLHHREAVANALARSTAKRVVGKRRYRCCPITFEPIRIESFRVLPQSREAMGNIGTRPRPRQITRPRPVSSPPMKLAFEFSSTQAERPVRLLYVSLSEVTPVEIA